MSLLTSLFLLYCSFGERDPSDILSWKHNYYLQAAAASEQEMMVFEEVVAPAMVECQELLKKSGDSVSDQGLELLAKWKLGMKK